MSVAVPSVVNGNEASQPPGFSAIPGPSLHFPLPSLLVPVASCAGVSGSLDFWGWSGALTTSVCPALLGQGPGSGWIVMWTGGSRA